MYGTIVLVTLNTWYCRGAPIIFRGSLPEVLYTSHTLNTGSEHTTVENENR